MSCDNKCSTDIGRGCKFCNCSSDTSATACEGCYKLHTTDWLEDYTNIFPEDILEIRFKNTRKGYYQNANNLPLKRGDVVAVESSPGHDIGIVSMTGDMVARQMKRVGFNPQNGEYKKIYRKAKSYDIEKWQEAIAMEHTTMIKARQIAADINLNMKIGDVEYQGDKVKAIFYYIADERVDFRELIKVFAEKFRIRIEMKQIGARQEAGRIGGLGSCGRELCCASWISNFVSVTTNSARHQEISLNPQKLAGQCSKLKCCLVYELDTYLDARKEFPRVNQPLQAIDGEYFLVKTDILGGTMSFSTTPNAMVGVVTIPLDRVKEIIDMNRKGKKVDNLIDYTTIEEKPAEIGFVNVIGEDSINRFDKKREAQRPKSRNNRGKGGSGSGSGNGEANGQRENGSGGGSSNGSGGGSRENRPHNGNRNGNRPRPNNAEGGGKEGATVAKTAAQGGSPEARQGGSSEAAQGGNAETRQGGNGNPNSSRNNNRRRKKPAAKPTQE